MNINISKPLKRKMKLKRTRGGWLWIDFKYEKLPLLFVFFVVLSVMRIVSALSYLMGFRLGRKNLTVHGFELLAGLNFRYLDNAGSF